MNLVTREDFESQFPMRTAAAADIPNRRSVVLASDLTVSSDTSLRGVIQGNVLVKEGAQLNFHGVIKGSLNVEPGATAYVNGVIQRDLLLRGGALLIGVVKGNVHPKPTAELHLEGVVKGRIIE